MDKLLQSQPLKRRRADLAANFRDGAFNRSAIWLITVGTLDAGIELSQPFEGSDKNFRQPVGATKPNRFNAIADMLEFAVPQCVRSLLDRLLTLKDIPQGKLFFPQSRNEAENGRQEEEEMEATLSQQHGDATLDQRIDRMHARDRAGLVIFIAVLWCTMLFALFSVWSYISIPTIRVILSVACALVLTFNTAAIVAMLRHYVEDKHFIYGLDIKHLDEMRRRRA